MLLCNTSIVLKINFLVPSILSMLCIDKQLPVCEYRRLIGVGSEIIMSHIFELRDKLLWYLQTNVISTLISLSHLFFCVAECVFIAAVLSPTDIHFSVK